MHCEIWSRVCYNGYHSSQLILVIIFLLLSAGGSASLALVQLGDNGLNNVLHLLLLGLQVLGGGILEEIKIRGAQNLEFVQTYGVILQPFDLLVNNLLNFALLVVTQLATELLFVTELVLETK